MRAFWVFGFLIATSVAAEPEEVARYLSALKHNNGKPPIIKPFQMSVGDIGGFPNDVDYVVQQVSEDKERALIKATIAPRYSVPAVEYYSGRSSGPPVKLSDGASTLFLLQTGGGDVAERPIYSNSLYEVVGTRDVKLASGATKSLFVVNKIRRDRIDVVLKNEEEAKRLETEDKIKLKNEEEAKRLETEAKIKLEKEKITKALAEKKDAARWRNWSSIGQAKFIKFNGKTATLMKKDGTTVEVTKLSKSDLDWIKNKRWSK